MSAPYRSRRECVAAIAYRPTSLTLYRKVVGGLQAFKGAVHWGRSPFTGADAMHLDAYVNYRGTCEEAFRYYERHLGGKITMLSRHGDAPQSQLPADWRDKVLHARVEIGDGVLMGADIPS